MRILLLNVPHSAIGSRIPDDHLPPLGLLAVGGPLIDDGHDVVLLDADREFLPDADIIERAARYAPDVVMFGHSGSSSAHPAIKRIAAGVARRLPEACIVYGGVYPTYFWREVLREEPYVHAIVRGEGEETARRLVAALAAGQGLEDVAGLAYRREGTPVANRPATVIQDLDAYRIGWELIDHARYSYWGGLRAVVVQFSRGCPHQCTYCGQRGFWTRWRHRDPALFAKEIARLHREHGVRVFNFADENPTESRPVWRRFLEALIAEDVNVLLVGSARADHIVRDADILHLYKKAGWIRFLLGLEHTNEATLKQIKKGATPATDREAIRLLRTHNIISMATWVVGFNEESDRDYWRVLKRLLSYDPVQIQSLYATPHRWTAFFRENAHRRVLQTDLRLWDYKHQVLASRMSPLRSFVWVKCIEIALQGRPKALYRTYFHPDKNIRQAMQWYSAMGRRVWFHEIFRFFRVKRVKNGPTLAEVWGEPQDREGFSMRNAAGE